MGQSSLNVWRKKMFKEDMSPTPPFCFSVESTLSLLFELSVEGFVLCCTIVVSRERLLFCLIDGMYLWIKQHCSSEDFCYGWWENNKESQSMWWLLTQHCCFLCPSVQQCVVRGTSHWWMWESEFEAEYLDPHCFCFPRVHRNACQWSVIRKSEAALFFTSEPVTQRVSLYSRQVTPKSDDRFFIKKSDDRFFTKKSGSVRALAALRVMPGLAAGDKWGFK